MRRLAVAMVALMLGAGAAGCVVEEAQTVEDDRLTGLLGRGATTVQQITEATSDQALETELKRMDLSDVNRANAVVEDLLEERFEKVDDAELDALISEPHQLYGPASQSLRRFRGWAAELGEAKIASTEFENSARPVQEFLGHWNEYVEVHRRSVDGVSGLFEQAMAIRGPTERFLRACRRALRTKDAATYLAARRRYLAALERWGERLYDEDGLPRIASQPRDEPEAFDRLVEDANGSEEVSRFVRGVVNAYPKSVFAERLER
jgi:hypothetical protein